MDETTETEMSAKEKTLELIDQRICGIQAQVDRMNEIIEQSYDTGGHVVYVPDEKKTAAEIKRLKFARRRVVKDLDPLPKYNWKQYT